jgi:hypothetical protein
MPSRSAETNKTPAVRSAKGAAVLKAREEAGKSQRWKHQSDGSSARKRPARRRRLAAGVNHWPRNFSFRRLRVISQDTHEEKRTEPLSHSLKHVDSEQDNGRTNDH